MASSGYFNTTGYEGRYLQFSWVEVSQNVSSNTTTISWTLKGAGGGNVWYKAGNFKVVIAGETVFSSSTRIELANGTVVASGTYTFKHDADGTKKFTASAQAGIYTVAVNCTGSSSFTLDTIARASQPSCITWPEHTQNVGEFGDEISIHMNRNSSDFTHTVRYQFGTKSGTIATNVETGVKWVIPLTLMDLLPAATSGSGTIYVDTYNGSTKIGTKWCGFTATVPASVKPRCTIQVLDGTNIQGIYGNLVKGLSTLYVKTNFYAAYSSPVASYNVNANGVRYTANEITTGVISKAGTTTITATVKDKRGRTSDAVSASFTVLDYLPPDVTAISVKRCNEDGTANKRGAYVKVTFSAAISSLNSKNNALYYLYYKKSQDSSYTKVSLTALTNQYSVSNYSYIFAANTGSAYDIMVEAVDRHNTGSKSSKASTASAIFSWRGFKTSNGVEDGVGIGKVPNKANTLQVGWDAEFDKTVIRKGNHYTHSSPGTAGAAGYVRMATITHVAANADSPITFVFTRRLEASPMTVHVQFRTDSTTVDPDLKNITYEGSNYGAFLVKSATSVWDLYVQKASAYDTITLQDWYSSATISGRLNVAFPGDLVASLPTPWYRAGPLIAESILDCFFPVGSIILRYDHADPNTMFPGSTWVRIYGAFPWFTDEKGQIGLTGGEREHTLTVNELPVHTHGSVYSGNAAGTKTHAWLASGGSSMAYGTVETGGGQAHNNMPPYIQISAWRRTA